MNRVRVFCLVSIMLAMARAGHAQQAIEYASIGGRVADATGAMVPGVDVSARHLATNIISTGVTDLEGRFRFSYLRVGEYEFIARLAGFRTVSRLLTLTAGAAFDVPIVLSLESLDAQVTVAAPEVVLDAARTQIASTLGATEVTHLPLNGRHLLDLALLAPGVAPANIASTQLFPETSAVPGISLSVNSQRNLSNNFIVDGLSANDDAAGLSGMSYSVEAVEQFQVITSGGQAELGRALGGYINVVTRSGTNTLRGSLYDFVRHHRLNARHALSGTTLPMHQSQFGGSMGGPVIRDRTFYFANAEHRSLRQTGLTTITPAHVDAINAGLEAAGYGGPRIQTGEYDNPVSATNALAKIDHAVTTRSQIGVRYAGYRVHADNSRGAGGLTATTASSHLRNQDHALSLSHVYFLSPRTVLESRAQIAYSTLDAPASDRIGPAVAIAGVATFGTSSSSPTARRNTLVQVVNNLAHHRGAHALRFGVDVLHNDSLITFPRSLRGSYTFASLATFLAGNYNTSGFTQTFGQTSVAQQNPNLGFYVQDEWKAASAVTLNFGVRYDLQFLDTINTDRDNVAPRLGVAITPPGADRTVVRASAGLFYDRVPLRALANALLSAGNTSDPARLRQTIVTLSPAQAGAPRFPALLAAPVASVTLPNLTTMDQDFQNAYSRQASVEVEQQIGTRSTISAGYEFVRGRHLLVSVNQNVPTCVPAGINNGCRPNPTHANNNQYSSVGDSTYHGMHLSWVQRPASWGHYRVSYTLSRAMNNTGEFFFSSPIDPTDLSKDWGRSDNDRRHRVVVSATVEARGFQMSALAQAYSAPPLNITSGITTIHGTAGRPRVDGVFIDRNAGIGDPYFTLNARVSRTFHIGPRVRLDGMLEAFNLTNRANVLTRNTNFGAGSYPGSPSNNFMQVTSVSEPRALQISARARF